MTLYCLIDVATGTVLAKPAPLPPQLKGLADGTLADLTPLKAQVPEFDGKGFWPVLTKEGDAATREVDPTAKRVTETIVPTEDELKQRVVSAYRLAGVTVEAMVEALFEQLEGDPAALEAIIAARQAIKLEAGKPKDIKG